MVYRWWMLNPLPFITFGENAALSLLIKDCCAGCSRYVETNASDEQLRNRCFAGAQFRCTAMIKRYTAHPARTCGQPGYVYIRPRERIQVGGPAALGCLFCR